MATKSMSILIILLLVLSGYCLATDREYDICEYALTGIIVYGYFDINLTGLANTIGNENIPKRQNAKVNHD